MKTFLLASLLVLSSGAQAGQFGLEMGESTSSIRAKVNLTETGTNFYSTPNVPDGHPAFDDYRLLITPVHGLCRIQAWTPVIQSDAYGVAVKSKFDYLFEALESKYGANLKMDHLKGGSIWDEPRDWMTGLSKGERILRAYWLREEKSRLPDELLSISIETSGLNSSSALISIIYEFSNFNECAEWAKAREHSSL